MEREVLAARREVQGARHPDPLLAMLRELGKHAEAEAVVREAATSRAAIDTERTAAAAPAACVCAKGLQPGCSATGADKTATKRSLHRVARFWQLGPLALASAADSSPTTGARNTLHTHTHVLDKVPASGRACSACHTMPEQAMGIGRYAQTKSTKKANSRDKLHRAQARRLLVRPLRRALLRRQRAPRPRSKTGFQTGCGSMGAPLLDLMVGEKKPISRRFFRYNGPCGCQDGHCAVHKSVIYIYSIRYI